MNGLNDNGKKTVTVLQLVLACMGTALGVFAAQNLLLSGKVSVESENLFRDTVNRRLVVLEAADSRLEVRDERHDDSDRRAFADVEVRLRAIELTLAQIEARERPARKMAVPAPRRKKLAPIMAGDLHEQLRRVFCEISPYYRVAIEGRVTWPKLP